MKELLDRHYRRVIDQPLPPIGNLPPREAVRTLEGRQKVIGWAQSSRPFGEGRRAQRAGTPPYDFSWMWHELGVLGRAALTTGRGPKLVWRRVEEGATELLINAG